MPLSKLHRFAAILALSPGLALAAVGGNGPDAFHGQRKNAPVMRANRPRADFPDKISPLAESARKSDSVNHGPSSTNAGPFGDDAFRDFLRENRMLDDSLHYLQGENALAREDFDSALAYHLAIGIPAAGGFREDLLAQRSRIFARLWPTGATHFRDEDRLHAETDPHRPAFEWSAGTGHFRRLDRMGPSFPYGGDGFGAVSRDWRYSASARGTWPLQLGKQDLDLSLSASANRFSPGTAMQYETAMSAELPEGILANLSLSLSTGLVKSQDWGSYRYYGLAASKVWYFENAGASFETGYSRQWEGEWKRFTDNARARFSRGFAPAGEGNIQVSLEGAISRRESRSDLYIAPVRYLGDAADDQTGELALTLQAPQSNFSLSPGVSYGFPLPGGVQATAAAKYALDIYPEYAWNRIPWPDSLDPYSGDLAGLALDRADGRYYAAVLSEQDGEDRTYYGSIPMESGRTRRVDNRASLDLGLGKELPHGYSLSVGYSAEFGWTNLPKTAPADFRPWQWSLGIEISRASIW